MLTGGQVRTPRGVLAWRPVAPVAKAFQFLTASAKDRYQCLGVIGNWSHLTAANPGDHTPYSTHDIWVGGKHYVPKKGWEYAFDAKVPSPEKFESWFLGRLRTGHYPAVKYWNILGRHWSRSVVKNGKPFARASRSRDEHLHMSFMPGYEYAASVDILGDYDYWLRNGKNKGAKPVAQKPDKKPVGKPAGPDPMAVAIGKLPVLRKGSKGTQVKVAQACLVARGLWPLNDRSAREQIDGAFGDGTVEKVRALQKRSSLPVTGVIDLATWRAMLPNKPPAVVRGKDGFYVSLMQCLLLARGFDPGTVDGDAGDRTVLAIKRIQVTRKVRNSVVAGRGDGIGGTNTWVALITF